jgi:hypothetical protein
MQSLLGQFYNRIRGSQEDIASEGLTYILKSSVQARKVISQIIFINTGFQTSDLIFTSQSVGSKLERPDISGKDENGKEILIIESKFWASLTNNQPNEYLKRMGENTTLIFLVPTLRVRSVFEEILERVNEEYSEIELELYSHKIYLKNSNQHILIKTWDEILNLIKFALVEENNLPLVSDIDQIIGFCNTIDTYSFQPINDLDLSPSIPKKINSYYDIVDKVVDELKNRNEHTHTSGLVRTPQKYGYHRYFQYADFGMSMCLKLELWAEFADTPFWITLKNTENNSWIASSDLHKNLCAKTALILKYKSVDYGGEIYIAIKPKIGKTEDIVINDLANQIEIIANTLREEKTNAYIV